MYFRHKHNRSASRDGRRGQERREMTTTKKTRRSCNYHRAYMSTSRDMDIVAEFERGCTYAAWALSIMAAIVAFMWAVM